LSCFEDFAPSTPRSGVDADGSTVFTDWDALVNPLPPLVQRVVHLRSEDAFTPSSPSLRVLPSPPAGDVLSPSVKRSRSAAPRVPSPAGDVVSPLRVVEDATLLHVIGDAALPQVLEDASLPPSDAEVPSSMSTVDICVATSHCPVLRPSAPDCSPLQVPAVPPLLAREDVVSPDSATVRSLSSAPCSPEGPSPAQPVMKDGGAFVELPLQLQDSASDTSTVLLDELDEPFIPGATGVAPSDPSVVESSPVPVVEVLPASPDSSLTVPDGGVAPASAQFLPQFLAAVSSVSSAALNLATDVFDAAAPVGASSAPSPEVSGFSLPVSIRLDSLTPKERDIFRLPKAPRKYWEEVLATEGKELFCEGGSGRIFRSPLNFPDSPDSGMESADLPTPPCSSLAGLSMEALFREQQRLTLQLTDQVHAPGRAGLLPKLKLKRLKPSGQAVLSPALLKSSTPLRGIAFEAQRLRAQVVIQRASEDIIYSSLADLVSKLQELEDRRASLIHPAISTQRSAEVESVKEPPPPPASTSVVMETKLQRKTRERSEAYVAAVSRSITAGSLSGTSAVPASRQEPGQWRQDDCSNLRRHIDARAAAIELSRYSNSRSDKKSKKKKKK
jgi:hypothetical protein